MIIKSIENGLVYSFDIFFKLIGENPISNLLLKLNDKCLDKIKEVPNSEFFEGLKKHEPYKSTPIYEKDTDDFRNKLYNYVIADTEEMKTKYLNRLKEKYNWVVD